MSDLEVSAEKKNDYWSYDEAFEFTGHGRYNYLVLLTCCIISVGVSLDMFGFGVVVAAASCDLGLTISQTGLLVGSPFTGLLFAYAWGYYADTRGRRRALLVSTTVGFIFGVLTSFAVTWEMMLAAKIIGCSFSTASYTLTMTYLGESIRTKNRSQYLFIMNSMNLGSEVVSFALAYFILPFTFTYTIPLLSITYNSWRFFTLILAVPMGAGALLILSLHESPKFLAERGGDRLQHVLKGIFVCNGGEEKDFPKKPLYLSTTMNIENTSFCGSLAKQTVPLFTPPLLWRTLQLFYLIVLACAINNAFIMWFPTMLDIVFKSLSSEQSIDSSFCGSIRNVTVSQDEQNTCTGTISEETLYSGFIASLFFTMLNLVVVMFAAWRRLVLITAFLVAALSCLGVVLLNQPIASVVFFVLIQTTAVGIGSVASYFVDFYPTSCSGLATSLGFMLARFAAFTGVVVIGATIVDYCDVIFYIYASLALSGICVSLLLPPDRSG